MNSFQKLFCFLLFNIIIFTSVLSLPLTAQNSRFEQAWNSTSDFYLEKLQEYNVVGGALLFLEDGGVEEEIIYGLADISENRKVDRQTIFHWASITKTFTAIAIMQLRDQGLLSLDDPLTEYLPELRKIHNPFGSMDEITIRMAINHSTGLRNPTWPWGGNEEWHPFEPMEWEQLVAMFPYSEIEFEPGSKYSYSNPAIIFLGMIIEQLSGDPYEVYIDKNILKPLEMYHSYFNYTPAHLLSHRSNSYSVENGEPKARGLDFHTGITTSNGGLNASLNDMIKYLNFLLESSGSPHEVLLRPSLEELWEEELPAEDAEGVFSNVGLSFFIEEDEGRRLIGHTGTQHSFYSFFYIHPESKTAVLSVTNSDENYSMHQFREEVMQYVSESLFSLF